MLGVNGNSENTVIEVDHKDGRKNDWLVSDVKTQRFEDFQPLCKAANDCKRQICKKCKETNIYKNYCKGGNGERQYFSDENGKIIDAARTKIENWKNNGDISYSLYYYLLCSLLESADKVANTASVYGAYLKKLKKSALKKLVIEGADFELNDNEHEVYREDANCLIKRISGDILYLDPPYNSRQYGANYHMLNTIAEYKAFQPKGKTGLRDYTRSKYCSASSVTKEFEELIKNADFKYIFLSYNNEGLMDVEDIRQIMSGYGKYDLAQTAYQRFKADSNRVNKADSTVEYLHILIK